MKIVAHRGYSARFPENSRIAFEQAMAAGADWIETDVRRSVDGVLVCWHDADLQRVAGIDMAIARTPACVLTALALPGGARVHRLAEVLALARGRVPVMLDVKIDDPAGRAAIVQEVAAAGMTDQVVYGVRTAEHAQALLAAAVPVRRLAMPAAPAMLDAFASEQLLGARLWEHQVDAPAIARIRARGIEVWVTAGVRTRGEAPGYIDAARLAALRAVGIDAVLVNDVELGRRVAAQG
jgi:glycerophosphoryl diester phosphodiesterase